MVYNPTTTDAPGAWVVRRRWVLLGRSGADDEVVDKVAHFAETLKHAREIVARFAPEAICLPRHPQDESVVQEVWI